MQQVEITWVDSMMLNDGTWMDASDVLESMTAKACRHITVGFLVRENDFGICVAVSRNTETDPDSQRICGAVMIPKVCVEKRRNIPAKTSRRKVR